MGRGYLLLKGTRTRMAASFFYLLDVLRSIVLYRWRNVDHVIFVRYLMGTAYLPKPLFKLGYYFFKRIVPESRYMFLIDVSPNEAFKRIKSSRDQKEMFESLERLIEMRGRLIELAMTGGWIIIDGNQPQECIHSEIVSLINMS
jgi:thymidylate kinase